MCAVNVVHIPLFPSLISQIECEDFHSIRNSLISWIYEYQKTDKGVQKSNQGGWQSDDRFYQHPTFIKFYDYMLSHIVTFSPYKHDFHLCNMWININGKNDYNEMHDHPNSHMSGVFWIKIPNNSGLIRFKSPRSFARCKYFECISDEIKKNLYMDFCWNFNPEEGAIMLFPSDLEHSVTSNQSDEDRISIAFNLRFS